MVAIVLVPLAVVGLLAVATVTQYVLIGFEFTLLLAWLAFRQILDRRKNALAEPEASGWPAAS